MMCVYIHTYDIYIYIYIYRERGRGRRERDRNRDGSCRLCELFEFPLARTPVTLNV